MINTVKLTKDGYLVNAINYVPNDVDNTDYQAVQDWINNGNVPEPEYTEAELQAKELENTIASLKAQTKENIEKGVFYDGRFYPTTLLDQQNLASVTLAATIHGVSQEPYKLWCVVDGNWVRYSHTAEQITEVATIVYNYIKAQQDNYAFELSNLT